MRSAGFSIAVIVAAVLSMPLPAASQSAATEESYLTARDGYIKRFNSKEWGEADLQKVTQQEHGALRGLERQLNKIVGLLEGVTGEGKINIETLKRGELGFGALDGVVHAREDKTRVVVTTEGLLKAWLRGHRNWNAKGPNVPQDAAQAFQSELFYTQAISPDAAVGKYADLPLAKPQGAVAAAMLAARAQDIGPRVPGDILVAVVRGPRAFVASAPAAARIEPMAECRAIWDAAEKKAGEAFAKYQASGQKDKRQLDLQNKLEQEGDVAFRRCFAERAPKDPGFAKLISQAEQIIDRLR